MTLEQKEKNGIIKHIDGNDEIPYGVEFDENIYSHTCFWNFKNGCCLWCYEEQLELVEEKTNKDLVLNYGDKIIYINHNNKKDVFIVDDFNEITIKYFEEDSKFKVLKVERPEYKTVYEIKEEILDKEEKEYLNAVIKPFRDRVIYIEKIVKDMIQKECIYINLYNDEFYLPYFKKGTMYKNMEPEKTYTLEELGL